MTEQLAVAITGVIPNKWDISRFRYIFSFGKGLNITKENLQDEGIPCVNYGEIHSKYGFEVNPEKHKLKCVDHAYLKKSKNSLLNYGDFVFADTSEDIEGSGNFTYLNSDEKVFAGYHTVITRPVAGIDHRFLAYVIDSISFRSQIRKKVKGVKVFSITQGVLKDALVWLPLLKEQKVISNFLDQKTSQIDEAITIKEKQITLLKERKQILIQNAVTRGLDPDAPMRDSGVEWIGNTPNHWRIIRLKFLFSETNERTKTGEEVLFSLRMEHGLVPHENVSDKYISDENLVEYKVVYPGQMIMNRMRAAIGIFGLATAHGLVSPDYAVFDIDRNANPEYFLRLFKMPLLCTQFRLHSKGLGTGSSGFMRLYSENFGNIKIALPPVDEQGAIIKYIKNQSNDINKVIVLQIKQIEKLKEYKATLINSAVTGKIKVA